MEAPPQHPLKLARWVQRILAIDMHRMITGRANIKPTQLSGALRSTAAAMSKLIPPDIMVEAEQLIRADAEEREAEESPEVQELDDGEDGGASPLNCPAR